MIFNYKTYKLNLDFLIEVLTFLLLFKYDDTRQHNLQHIIVKNRYNHSMYFIRYFPVNVHFHKKISTLIVDIKH